MKQTAITAIVILVVLVFLMSFSMSIARAQDQNQVLNKPDNVNVSSSDEAVSEQTNVPSNNQTISTTNGVNGTSINVTSSGTPNNELEEQLQPQQERSTLLRQQQQQQPQPLAPPLSPPPQQPLYCYYPTYDPRCVSGSVQSQAIAISIVPGAATQLNQAFQPSLIYVNIGTRVTWINYDSQIHTVTSGSTGSPSEGQIFDSDILSPGAMFSLTLVQSGIFSYHCALHPQMVGTIVVS